MLFPISACKKSDTDYSNFVRVYAELRVAEREYGKTEDGKIVRAQILQRHGFSIDDFENKTEEIKGEPERWLEFQNMLIKILDSMANIREIEAEN